jgi:hypothetical protein
MTKTMHVIPSKGEKVVELTRRNTEEWEKKKQATRNHHHANNL